LNNPIAFCYIVFASSGNKYEGNNSTPEQFSKEELNDLIWNLNLSNPD